MPLLLGSEEHTSELQSPCNLVCLFFLDRKSTRLNSSHLVISYAVFCLKKKVVKNNVEQCTVNLQIITAVIVNEPQFPKPVLFFNHPATTEIYPLSLHDSLPISGAGCWGSRCSHPWPMSCFASDCPRARAGCSGGAGTAQPALRSFGGSPPKHRPRPSRRRRTSSSRSPMSGWKRGPSGPASCAGRSCWPCSSPS